MPKLLFLAGSARRDSINKKLARSAAALAQAAGADARFVDLKDFEMPIYDGDLEDDIGLPENAKALKKLFIESDGFFIASPEYNSSLPPLLKNAIDWISRTETDDEPSLVAFKGKVAAIGAVSPGALGGMRVLVPLRMLLGNIGVTVVPSQVSVPNGFEAFDDDGILKDGRAASMLENTINEFVGTARKLKGECHDQDIPLRAAGS